MLNCVNWWVFRRLETPSCSIWNRWSDSQPHSHWDCSKRCSRRYVNIHVIKTMLFLLTGILVFFRFRPPISTGSLAHAVRSRAVSKGAWNTDLSHQHGRTHLQTAPAHARTTLQTQRFTERCSAARSQKVDVRSVNWIYWVRLSFKYFRDFCFFAQTAALACERRQWFRSSSDSLQSGKWRGVFTKSEPLFTDFIQHESSMNLKTSAVPLILLNF